MLVGHMSVSRPDRHETPFSSGPVPRCGKTTNHLFGTFTAAKGKIVHAGRRRATEMMRHGDQFGFHIEDERETLPLYNPTVEDADPDDDPVTKDPGNWDRHWNERRRERNKWGECSGRRLCPVLRSTTPFQRSEG